MKRYLFYFWYILRHKLFVFQECLILGISWLGVIHDWSKFLPSEFIPYARYFYNPDGSLREIRDETGYYRPTDTGNLSFDYAWLLHQKRNKHHWQFWLLPEDEGGTKVFPMPEKYRLEMLADWIGAGRALGTPDTVKWYNTNKDKMTLHVSTREWIENMLRSKR